MAAIGAWVAAVVALYFGDRQAALTRAANETSRESLVTVQRSFVNVSDLTLKSIRNKDGSLEWWTADVFLENSGAIPTQDLQIKAMSKRVLTSDPKNPSIAPIDFAQLPPAETVTSNILLGPHAKTLVLPQLIPRDLERDMMLKKYNVYVFGTAKYRDRLTKQAHETRFCVVIAAPPSQLTPIELVIDKMDLHIQTCPLNNCADEECRG